MKTITAYHDTMFLGFGTDTCMMHGHHMIADFGGGLSSIIIPSSRFSDEPPQAAPTKEWFVKNSFTTCNH